MKCGNNDFFSVNDCVKLFFSHCLGAGGRLTTEDHGLAAPGSCTMHTPDDRAWNSPSQQAARQPSLNCSQAAAEILTWHLLSGSLRNSSSRCPIPLLGRDTQPLSCPCASTFLSSVLRSHGAGLRTSSLLQVSPVTGATACSPTNCYHDCWPHNSRNKILQRFLQTWAQLSLALPQ